LALRKMSKVPKNSRRIAMKCRIKRLFIEGLTN
jgi:hypothetical protein